MIIFFCIHDNNTKQLKIHYLQTLGGYNNRYTYTNRAQFMQKQLDKLDNELVSKLCQADKWSYFPFQSFILAICKQPHGCFVEIEDSECENKQTVLLPVIYLLCCIDTRLLEFLRLYTSVGWRRGCISVERALAQHPQVLGFYPQPRKKKKICQPSLDALFQVLFLFLFLFFCIEPEDLLSWRKCCTTDPYPQPYGYSFKSELNG